MRPFTDEEFEIMISELTDAVCPSFDMLCVIAERTLRPKIQGWCNADGHLRGKGEEDDIMQETLLRLVKTTTYGFLLRADRKGEINRDPDGFMKWMIAVAKHIKADFSRRFERRDEKVRAFAEGEESRVPDPQVDRDETEDLQIAQLKKAFGIVFDSDKQVYIVLTWLAQILFVLEWDLTKIQATRLMEKMLSEKTLFEMRDIVLTLARKVEWLQITDEQMDRLDQTLHEPHHNDLLGHCRYQDFYMKKGGKASISDWINRVNRMIERLM